MDPITLALAGLLAYRTYQGQGKLAEWIGHKGPNADPASAIGGAPSQQLPPLLQSLGAAPLAQGLSDLLKDFQQKGFGETIKSWVDTGPNKLVSTGQLEQALGEEKKDRMAHEANGHVSRSAARRIKPRTAAYHRSVDAGRSSADRARNDAAP